MTIFEDRRDKGLIESPKVHVAMLGARMHYAVPRLLHETGLLGRFCTDSSGR